MFMSCNLKRVGSTRTRMWGMCVLLLGAVWFAGCESFGEPPSPEQSDTEAPVTYTGTAHFPRRTDPADEGVLGHPNESFESRRVTLEHDIAGRDAIERVAEDLGLLSGPEFPRTADGQLTEQGERAKRDLVRDIRERVDVRWEAGSPQAGLIAVSFTDPDADLAEKLPNALVRNYITWVSDEIMRRLRRGEEFLQEQVDNCQRRYDEANAARIDFVEEYAQLWPARPGGLEAQIHRIESDIARVRKQHELAEQMLARLQRHKEEPARVRESAEDPLAEGATRRPAAEADPEDAGAVPGPDPARIEEQLEDTPEEVVVADEGDEDALPEGDLAAEIASVQSKIEITGQELGRLESRLAALKELTGEYEAVRQEYEQILGTVADRKAELTGWQKRYREVQMALEAEQAKRRTHHESIVPAEARRNPPAATED